MSRGTLSTCNNIMDLDIKIKLSGEAMRQFSVAKIFKESNEQKRCLSFSNDGHRLVVCDHQNMIVYSCTTLTQLCQVFMHQYHPEAVCFTHKADQLLHSATRLDHTIRCLDIESRQHLRLFNGHTNKIHCLSFQPGNEHNFMSAGRDNRLCMWDMRSSIYTMQLEKLESPLFAYDPNGLVFALSAGTEKIEIYDVRMLGGRPCHKFNYKINDFIKWTQLQFSPDGKWILVSTDYSWCFSVNGFNGSFGQGYTGYANVGRLPLQACYTSDAKFVLSGADAGRVHVWNASSGELVAVLNSKSFHPVSCLQFNPKMAMFVSSDVMTYFWLPKADGRYEFVEDTKAEPETEPSLLSSIKSEPTVDLTNTDDSDQEELELVGVQPYSQQMRWHRLKRRLYLSRRSSKEKSIEEGEIPDDN